MKNYIYENGLAIGYMNGDKVIHFTHPIPAHGRTTGKSPAMRCFLS